MIYINLLFVAIICTYIINVSGFWDEASSRVSSWLTDGRVNRPITFKPFSCELCMTFWLGLAYLIFAGAMSLGNIAVVCLFSFSTRIIASIMVLAEGLVQWLIDKINNLINK